MHTSKHNLLSCLYRSHLSTPHFVYVGGSEFGMDAFQARKQKEEAVKKAAEKKAAEEAKAAAAPKDPADATAGAEAAGADVIKRATRRRGGGGDVKMSQEITREMRAKQEQPETSLQDLKGSSYGALNALRNAYKENGRVQLAVADAIVKIASVQETGTLTDVVKARDMLKSVFFKVSELTQNGDIFDLGRAVDLAQDAGDLDAVLNNFAKNARKSAGPEAPDAAERRAKKEGGKRAGGGKKKAEAPAGPAPAEASADAEDAPAPATPEAPAVKVVLKPEAQAEAEALAKAQAEAEKSQLEGTLKSQSEIVSAMNGLNLASSDDMNGNISKVLDFVDRTARWQADIPMNEPYSTLYVAGKPNANFKGYADTVGILGITADKTQYIIGTKKGDVGRIDKTVLTHIRSYSPLARSPELKAPKDKVVSQNLEFTNNADVARLFAERGIKASASGIEGIAKFDPSKNVTPFTAGEGQSGKLNFNPEATHEYKMINKSTGEWSVTERKADGTGTTIYFKNIWMQKREAAGPKVVKIEAPAAEPGASPAVKVEAAAEAPVQPVKVEAPAAAPEAQKPAPAEAVAPAAEVMDNKLSPLLAKELSESGVSIGDKGIRGFAVMAGGKYRPGKIDFNPASRYQIIEVSPSSQEWNVVRTAADGTNKTYVFKGRFLEKVE